MLIIVATSIIFACEESSSTVEESSTVDEDIKEDVDKIEQEETVEDVRKVIEEKNRKLVQWYQAGEVDSIINVMSEDIVQLPPHSEALMGREAVRRSWTKNFEAGEWDLQFNTQEIRTCGEMAVEMGSYTLNFIPAEEGGWPEFEDYGQYVVLWEKEEGEWKMVWDAPVPQTPWNGPEEAVE